MTLGSECRGRTSRDRREILLPKVKSTIGYSNFKFTGAKDWNELPNELRVDGLTLGSFKRKTFISICKNKTKHSINVDCRLIHFNFLTPFVIANISRSAFLLCTIVFF